MYKVTIYRYKMKWFGGPISRGPEIEQYINDFAKTGYELVSTNSIGIYYVTCIWKKV